ncbi:copper transport outer membrane protein MctB [Orenia metallireducens]|jgi:hypothetical protein|uniref:Copper transport outer membrane protein, MctB n=1 Tax=Orenia metallireducens TaxID=1413210 RepID=A0A285HMB5_9FIRM|nr:copper transporter [Orenia metallireducens]PRX26943.1 copper transport outer membrane protein MctB [Orenia metallireducens]SNY36804.1 Copper transport outer membrane protein, MctB [Orenia metallireducens]
MLVDLRYHVITIVIIFVTLAIGILIGSSMVGNDLIVNEQKHLISNLEEDFKSLRTKNKEFSKEVNYLETRLADNINFQKMIMPLVVKEQLKDQSLLVVVGNNVDSELKNKIIKTLKLADVQGLEVIEDLTTIGEKSDFTKVLLLGDLDEGLNYPINLKEKSIKIDLQSIKSISGLIKLVFEVAAKDLPDLEEGEHWINQFQF